MLCLSLSACFSSKKTGKVVDYKPGRVITKKGYYQVGGLSSDWRRLSLEKAVISFYNQDLGATIATDAFCEQAYDDAPLDMLTKHLFAGLQDVKVLSSRELMLDGRAALHSSLSAKLDGVPVKLETVTIKKDWCLFDFYLVSPPEQIARALPDFLQFFKGFAYAGEI